MSHPSLPGPRQSKHSSAFHHAAHVSGDSPLAPLRAPVTAPPDGLPPATDPVACSPTAIFAPRGPPCTDDPTRHFGNRKRPHCKPSIDRGYKARPEAFPSSFYSYCAIAFSSARNTAAPAREEARSRRRRAAPPSPLRPRHRRRPSAPHFHGMYSLS